MMEVVILAAGEGKRMRSALPKVLQPVGGRPMLCHLLDAAEALEPAAVHIVVGAGAEHVRQTLVGRACRFVTQSERLGTGHAVQQALPGIDAQTRVLILPGDMPLIRPNTLRRLSDCPAELALLSFIAEDPTGYGRILRDDQGHVLAIREQRDASVGERAVREVNSGVMCARAGEFSDWLSRVRADNTQGEYYLTDCIALAANDGKRVDAVVTESAHELEGANDRLQLARLEHRYQQWARHALFEQGATLPDPGSVQVRGRVRCGRDVLIDAGVILEGEIDLGDGVVVGPGCVLRDCQLAAGTRLEPYCVLDGVRTTGACGIGPFARLRPGTELAAGVKVGNFVEIKNTRLAAGAKASHLSYVGDAEIGAHANLGAGTIICNYDGVNKHRTVVEQDAFIGSNTALVAPVRVGAGATIGAGSVITSDAPDGELTLARTRQRTVPGWVRPRPEGGKAD